MAGVAEVEDRTTAAGENQTNDPTSSHPRFSFQLNTPAHIFLPPHRPSPPHDHHNPSSPSLPLSSLFTIMTIPMNGSAAYDLGTLPRPKDVGILAMEMYFPQRVSIISS